MEMGLLTSAGSEGSGWESNCSTTASSRKTRPTTEIGCRGKRDVAQKDTRTERVLLGLHVLALREQVESQSSQGKTGECKRQQEKVLAGGVRKRNRGSSWFPCHTKPS